MVVGSAEVSVGAVPRLAGLVGIAGTEDEDEAREVGAGAAMGAVEGIDVVAADVPGRSQGFGGEGMV